jgi:uncharacterized protein
MATDAPAAPPLPIQHTQPADDGQGAFFIEKEGTRAGVMTYHLDGDTATIQHTEVGDVLRGTGAGKRLVQAAVDWARTRQLKIIPRCPFARATFAKHPELRDVLAPDFQL